MRKKAAVLAWVCVMGLCGGCGQDENVEKEQETALFSEEASVPEEENGGAESDESGVSQSESGSEKTDDTQEGGEPSPSAEEVASDEKGLEIPENGRRLTSEELAVYTEWVQDLSNYGFLLSDWENPAQIDLYQVFYSSAGVGRPGTEEEKRAYLERWNQAEIETDFGAIDKAAVDALLLKKVGFTYDELMANGSEGMEDWYYAETDSFCSESGDTNYCRFICTDGVSNEDGTVVTLQCDDWVRTCEVKVSVDSGRFLAL